MTAAAILTRAEAAGVRVEVDGSRLRPSAPAPPPAELIHALAGVKEEVLALLAQGADGVAERAAIQAEPPLPLHGTAERERLDAVQSTTLAGLLAAAKASRWLPSKKSDTRNGESTA